MFSSAVPLRESSLSARCDAAITLSIGIRCASYTVAMHSQAPGELGLTAIAFIASARARANWLFLRSSLQLRIGSLMRTMIATRCAMESANAMADSIAQRVAI